MADAANHLSRRSPWPETRADGHPPAMPMFGDRFLRERRTAALLVPSAVCPGEHNWLLNPEHQDFGKLASGKPQRKDLDPRRLR